MTPALAGSTGQAVPKGSTSLQLALSVLKPSSPTGPGPASPFPGVGQKMYHRRAGCLHHPSAIWGWGRDSWQTRRRAHAVISFSFSCSFAPFLWLRNLPPLVRQGWAFWIVFICWHSGVKALPVNCILILSAVCICFPLPLSPGLIYGFPLPCFLLSQWQGVLCYGCSGLGQEEGLSL